MERNENDQLSFDEIRRQKAENFHLNITDGTQKEDKPPQEINSYSGQDVKEQIARESMKSERKRQRQQKRDVDSIGSAGWHHDSHIHGNGSE